MNFHQITQIPFGMSETTESMVGLSGKRFSDTRDVSPYELLTSTLVNLLDTENFFTQKEEVEIFRSLIDLKTGNYKTFHTTEELFADLDS